MAVVAAAACGGGGTDQLDSGNGSAGRDAAIGSDAHVADAAPDAPIDSRVLPDAAIDAAIDAPPDAGTCDVFAQTGCATSEKCTWIVDSATANLGHVGCAQAGAVAAGAACTFSNADHSGFDNCVAGDYCIDGSCETVCDPQAAGSACDALHSCGTYEGVFSAPGGAATAGLCDPTCDPLTQAASAPIAGITAACGSPTPCSGSGAGCGSDGPQAGCYPSFTSGTGTCANSPEARGAATPTEDNQPCLATNSCANATGNAFLNGCAPGFVAFFLDAQGSTEVDCNAVCAPLDTDSAQAAHGIGDVTALGKLPTDAAPVVGHAVCSGARAGAANEECSFVWPVLVNAGVTGSPFNDTLGVCFSPSKFTYDPAGGATGTKVDPACATLRPGTVEQANAANLLTEACSNAATGTEADCFAVTHGCYNFEHSQPGAAPFLTGPHVAPHVTRRGPYRLALGPALKMRRPGGLRY